MNRKLLNGLLVLAVAAGGVGTFTSCKDEDFQNQVLLDQLSLQAQIDAIRGVSDQAFKQNLEAWLNGWTKDITNPNGPNEDGLYEGFTSYEELVQAAQAMWDIYQSIMSDTLTPDAQAYVEALYNWMFNSKTALADWIELINKVAERATSVEVNQVFNPVFGTINLPVGINTTVLATYLYEGEEYAKWPLDLTDQFADASVFRYSDDNTIQSVIKTLSASVSIPLTNESFTTATNFGNMGGAAITINPSSNDFTNTDKYTIELVNSKGEAVLSSVAVEGEDVAGIELKPYDDMLYFGSSVGSPMGATRAEEATNNGIYALSANATKSTYQGMKFDLETKSELKDAIKDAVHNKTISDIAHVGQLIFEAVNYKLPAYAVKVSWEEPDFTLDDEEGSAEETVAAIAAEDEDGEEQATIINSVTSEYNIAAVVAHPLSYGTRISEAIPGDKQLPIINSLADYLDEIGRKLTIDIDPIGDIDHIDMTFEFTGNGIIRAYLYDEDGNKTDQYVEIPYGEDGLQIGDEGYEESLNYFVNELLKQLGEQTEDNVNKVIDSLNESIANINSSLESFKSTVGSFNDYIEEIKESSKLNYAQKLVDFYNKLAKKANNFLKNPDRYLQVALAYSAGNGPHFVSSDAYMATTVPSGGDGVSLYMASYTGDVLVPSFKKYVAITGIVNEDNSISTEGLESLNSQAGLNKVFPGQQHRLAINTTGLRGKKVRLSYISVDYRGVCSMNNYYLTFE